MHFDYASISRALLLLLLLLIEIFEKFQKRLLMLPGELDQFTVVIKLFLRSNALL
jgi:hypothetical protein